MIHLAASLARHLPGLSETRPDGELLASFRSDRDEVAFAELVRRHGPLVWSACRRLLPDPADAEDAFQATFLVLVRRAHRLAGQPTLGPWLYQVAVWTARNMRRRNARILARRIPRMPDVADPAPGPQAFDLRTDLDEALLALPEKYRTALVLCHLQGWSRREAAARLGCPEGTLSSLLARGLDRLRIKLKGLDPTKALAIGATSVPLVLASATVKAATGFHLAAACAATSTASLLAEGVLRMFWIKKATAASFALVAVFGFGMSLGVSVNQMPGAVAGEGETLVAGGGDDRSEYQILLEREITETNARIAALEARDRDLRNYLKRFKGDDGAQSSSEQRIRDININTTEQSLQENKRSLDSAYLRLFELSAKKALTVAETAQKTLAKLQRQLAYAQANERTAREALRLTQQDANVLPRREEEVAKAIQLVAKSQAALAEFLLAQKQTKAAAEGETLFADGPGAEKTSAEDELFQKKLELLKRKLAIASKGVELSKLKAEVSKEAFANGTGSFTDHLQDQITLTRFVENHAQAVSAVAQLEIEIAVLMATRKPAENQFQVIKLKNVQAEDVVKVLDELFNGVKKDGNRIRLAAEKSSNSLIILKASPADLLTIRKLLEKVSDAAIVDDQKLRMKIAENVKPQPDGVRKAYLDVVIAGKNETWPYSIHEFGPGNKAVGTVYFENFEVLKRFLARIGAEAGGPKTVYFTGPADAKNETIQAILEVCKAAGLHVLAQRYADKADLPQPATGQPIKLKFKLSEQPDPK